MCAHTHIHRYTAFRNMCIHTCMHIHIYSIPTCTCIHIHICKYTHKVYEHTHTHEHTHMHTDATCFLHTNVCTHIKHSLAEAQVCMCTHSQALALSTGSLPALITVVFHPQAWLTTRSPHELSSIPLGRAPQNNHAASWRWGVPRVPFHRLP